MINVKFQVLSLEDQVSIIQSFLSSDSRQSRMVADYFGLNLKELISLPKMKRKIQIETVVTELYNQKLEQMKEKVDVFQKAWDEKSDFINSEFRKIFGKKINLDCQGYINLNPVWPRFLKNKSFDVNYQSDNDFLLLSCTHEIVHFAWFELWKSNFPEHSDEEFEYPISLGSSPKSQLSLYLDILSFTPYQTQIQHMITFIQTQMEGKQ